MTLLLAEFLRYLDLGTLHVLLLFIFTYTFKRIPVLGECQIPGSEVKPRRGAPDRKISVRPDNRTGLIEAGYRPDRTLSANYRR